VVVVSQRGARLLATVATLAVHGAAAAVLLTVNPARFSREKPVEMDVVEPPPPPLPATPEPPPPPPRPVPRRVAIAMPTPPPPEAAPPPPNQEPPPNTPPAPPVFGVTLDSTVEGNSRMAVPVGNTVATNDRTPAPPGPPPRAYSGAGAPTSMFTPIADVYISEPATVLVEVNSADIYPADARRMGIEGVVELRVGIDEQGDVRERRRIEIRMRKSVESDGTVR